MGKASRWMMNLLLGKKGKNKIKEAPASFSEEMSSRPAAVSPGTPARWSFGISLRKEKWRSHRGSRSLDLIPPLAALDLEEEEKSNMTKKSNASLSTTQEARGMNIRAIREAAAAIKIQAVFRSYMARKALRALRGLVKLQAVVRGHLVRKQTTAVIRQMQALMAIQVRARFQRIHMADESSSVAATSHSMRYRIITPEKGSKRVHRESLDISPSEGFGGSKSKKGCINHTEDETCYSGDFSGSSKEAGNEHDQVSSFRAGQIPGRASFSYLLQQDNSLLPNYMAKTESFRAKGMSESAPRQRPKLKLKPKSKRSPSFDGSGVVGEQASSYSGNRDEASFESLGPWFVKLYRPRRQLKDDGNSSSSRSADPNYWE